MRSTRLLAVAILALVVSAAPVAAQDPGAVYGRLSIVESRGPVADAVVRFVELRTDRTVTLRTDEQGRFARLGLRPGRYRATIEREGFAAVDVVGIDVRSSDHVRIDVEMTPFDEAPFKRQTIRYRRPLVNTRDASLGTKISGY